MKRVDILAGIVIAVLVIWFVLANGDHFGDHPVSIGIGALLVIGYLFAAWLSRHHEEPPPPEKERPPLSDNYGAADFAPQSAGVNSLATGIFFGKSSTPALNGHGVSQNHGGPVCSEPERHTLIVAATRSGKATRLIIPTLLRNMASSCIVIDPKGELAAVTAKARARYQDVHIVNPWGELQDTFQKIGFGAATYNPLDMLDPADPNAVALAQEFAAAICPAGDGKDAFWMGSAGDLLAATLLFIAYQPDEEKTLTRARQITSLDRTSLAKMIARMCAIEAYNGGIRQLVGQYLDMAQETYSGITSTLNRRLAFITDTRVQQATMRSTFSMRDLTGFGKERPTTVYVVAPTSKLKTQMIWLRLLIKCAISAFRDHPGTRRYRCLFILDEFANIGRIDDMPLEVTFAAGQGIDFMLVIQNFSQLKATYGEHDNTIIGNCAFKYFCNVDELQTAKYVSEALGQRTVGTETKGETKGQSNNKGGGSESEGESTTYGEMGKLLLAPNEVMQLGPDKAILFAPKSKPHFLRPVDYWRLPEAFPGQLSNPPFEYEANPLVSASTGRRATDPIAPPAREDNQADETRPSTWQKVRGWLNERPNQKPAPQAPTQQGPSGPPRKYDYGLYSPANPDRKPWQPLSDNNGAPEGQGEGTGQNGPSAPPAAVPKRASTYDPTYYSPDKIAEREAAEAEKNKPPAPPPTRTRPRDGELDIESDTFTPFKKPDKKGGG